MSRVGCLALGWLQGCAASTVLTSLWYLFARHVAVTWVFGVLDKAIVASLRYLEGFLGRAGPCVSLEVAASVPKPRGTRMEKQSQALETFVNS